MYSKKQETYADTDFPTEDFKNGNKVDFFCFYHGEVHVWKRLNTLPLRLRLPVYTAWTCGCSLVSSPWLFVPTYMKVGFASALLPFFLFSFWAAWQASRHGHAPVSGRSVVCGAKVWTGQGRTQRVFVFTSSAAPSLPSPTHLCTLVHSSCEVPTHRQQEDCAFLFYF